MEESAEIKAGIVRAAMRVFAERGYQQTTLADVAGLVGLSRPGLLHHFPSKEALFRAVLDELREWAGRQMEAVRLAGPPGLRELEAFIGASEESRLPLQLVHVLEGEAIAGNEAARDYTVVRTRRIHGEISRRLLEARRAGAVPEDVDVETLSLLIVSTINGLQRQWLIDPSADTRAAFEEFTAQLTARFQGVPATGR